MEYVKIEELAPHALHAELYGAPEEADGFDDLVEDIRENGQLYPLVIDESLQVISGSRRLAALKVLEMKEVWVDKQHFDSEEAKILRLLSENEYRVKTELMKVREGVKKQEMLQHSLALRKQGIIPTENDLLTNIARPDGKVVTRDEAGRAVGLKPRTFQTGKKLLKEIDRLKEEGKEDLAAKVEKKAETSISGALKLAEGKVPEKEDPHDTLYWYKPSLRRAEQNMIGYSTRLQKRCNNTTPAAFMFFLENMMKMAERIATWMPENLEDCPICKGTMSTPSGAACTNCFNGKTGKYLIPEAAAEPESPGEFMPLYCTQCGDSIGRVEHEDGGPVDNIDEDVVFNEEMGYMCGPCARGLELQEA